MRHRLCLKESRTRTRTIEGVISAVQIAPTVVLSENAAGTPGYKRLRDLPISRTWGSASFTELLALTNSIIRRD